MSPFFFPSKVYSTIELILNVAFVVASMFQPIYSTASFTCTKHDKRDQCLFLDNGSKEKGFLPLLINCTFKESCRMYWLKHNGNNKGIFKNDFSNLNNSWQYNDSV